MKAIVKMLWVASISVFLLSACQSAQDALTSAATQRWNALIHGDMNAAYQLYTKAFQQTTTLDVFKNTMHGTGLWNKANVKAIHCADDGKHCNVDIEVTISMKMRGVKTPVETSSVIKETWVNEGWFSDWRYIKQ